jgi:hypothetical protein
MRNAIATAVVVLFVAIYIATPSRSQEKTGGASAKARVISETSGGDSIPDVNNVLSLVTLLRQPQIAKAAGVNPEIIQRISKELSDKDGSFAVQISKGIPQTRDELEKLRSQLAKERNSREEWLDELLTPAQWKRLRELAYQTEIARVGWGEALTKGRLGRDAGVTENQHTALRNRVGKIEAETQQKILQLLAESQEKILAELSTEQRSKAKTLLGDPVLILEVDPRKPK